MLPILTFVVLCLYSLNRFCKARLCDPTLFGSKFQTACNVSSDRGICVWRSKQQITNLFLIRFWTQIACQSSFFRIYIYSLLHNSENNVQCVTHYSDKSSAARICFFNNVTNTDSHQLRGMYPRLYISLRSLTITSIISSTINCKMSGQFSSGSGLLLVFKSFKSHWLDDIVQL